MLNNQKNSESEKKSKPSLKFLRDQEREMVKGIFRYYEVPGGVMEFVFKKYKWDPIEKYSLKDGEVYTLPLGVARHLNKNCSYPSYTFKKDESGLPVTTIGEHIRRCGFQSLEFVDIEGVSAK